MKSEVLIAINNERNYQTNKWGSNEANPHTIFEWIGIMEHELAEAKEAYFQRPCDPLMLVEILQVVTVGVACLEQHGVVERWGLQRAIERATSAQQRGTTPQEQPPCPDCADTGVVPNAWGTGEANGGFGDYCECKEQSA